MKSTDNVSIISHDYVYEEVTSQISEDVGWSSTEFGSDSGTDENSPDFDIIDKPLPLIPNPTGQKHNQVGLFKHKHVMQLVFIDNKRKQVVIYILG